ncbi:hypothetical protein BC830DRAFT_591645 [Chytriomyces sp. MP71]|nr:hypothetical protein BC830DRAFT_591645 [Chytriomyces sp. MP71]
MKVVELSGGLQDYSIIFTDGSAGTQIEIAMFHMNGRQDNYGAYGFIEDFASQKPSCLEIEERSLTFSNVKDVDAKRGGWATVAAYGAMLSLLQTIMNSASIISLTLAMDGFGRAVVVRLRLDRPSTCLANPHFAALISAFCSRPSRLLFSCFFFKIDDTVTGRSLYTQNKCNFVKFFEG